MATAEQSQTRAIYELIGDVKLPDAMARLQAVLQITPGSRGAASLLAYCFYQQEDYESAAQMYQELSRRLPQVPQYHMYCAQSLCKAGRYVEAAQAIASVQGFPKEVSQVQAAIQFESGDLRGCKASLEAALATGEPAAMVNAGCVLYKEGQFAAAAAQFAAAAQTGGYSAEVAYALAACQYRLHDHSAALAVLAEVVQAGVHQHPELAVGSQTEGLEARSVGNSPKLRQTALVEAFNLRAAIELSMGSAAGAAAALSDMPPRQEHELDPVTLHNRALVGLAQGGWQAEEAALDKLTHLLYHPPFPPELLPNLLSLCARHAASSQPLNSAAPSRIAVVESVLQDHASLVAMHVPPELVPLYEASLVRCRSPGEAAAKMDTAAGQHIEGLRRRMKAVQDARWAGDQAGAAAGMEEYEAALEAYIPVLMALAQLHWEAGAYACAQEVLQQSAEFCSDHPVWRLNLAHALAAVEGGGRMAEAAELYESLVQHYSGAADDTGSEHVEPVAGSEDHVPADSQKGSLLEVPPTALANLCVCHVVAGRMEAAEELLRLLEDETAAAMAAAPAGTAIPVPRTHLALANLAIGTLYCAKGNFEFGLTRVMRSLEPLPAGLDAQRWHGVMLCLLCLLDQAAKNMLVLKDGLAANLLAFLEDVETAGAGCTALQLGAESGGVCSGGSSGEGEQDVQQPPQSIASQARSLKAVLLQMCE